MSRTLPEPDAIHFTINTRTMRELFPSLQDEASIWVWISSRPIEDHESNAILDVLRGFIGSWTSHGRAVRGEAAVVMKRILLIAGDVDAGDLSGCGIDKSVHAIESIATELGFEWVTALGVAFSRAGSSEIEVLDRAEFRRLAESGTVPADILIYDRAPRSLGSVRRDGLAKPASSTWASRYFATVPAPPVGGS